MLKHFPADGEWGAREPGLQQPSPRRTKRIHSRAFKPASLDHITQRGVPSSSPPKSLSCRYETSWTEEKGTQWPLLRGREGGKNKRKRERGGGGSQMSAGSPSALSLVRPDTLRRQRSSCKHSTAAQWPSPRKLSPLTHGVVGGAGPEGARSGAGAGQVGAGVNQGGGGGPQHRFCSPLRRLRRSSFLSTDPGETKPSLQQTCGPGWVTRQPTDPPRRGPRPGPDRGEPADVAPSVCPQEPGQRQPVASDGKIRSFPHISVSLISFLIQQL